MFAWEGLRNGAETPLFAKERLAPPARWLDDNDCIRIAWVPSHPCLALAGCLSLLGIVVNTNHAPH